MALRGNMSKNFCGKIYFVVIEYDNEQSVYFAILLQFQSIWSMLTFSNMQVYATVGPVELLSS